MKDETNSYVVDLGQECAKDCARAIRQIVKEHNFDCRCTVALSKIDNQTGAEYKFEAKYDYDTKEE